MIRILKNTSEPLNFQLDKAYPLTDATAIEKITEGISILTEFENPRDKPSQFIPVQACDQALTHGAKVTSTGGAKILPRRISGIPLSDVTIITYSGNA